jgi:SAM-dependent methyltransferase
MTAPVRECADVSSSSADYARRFSGAVGAYFLELQAEITLSLLDPFPASRVLDLGGGHGQLAGPLASAGHAVTVFGSALECASRIRPLLEHRQVRFVAGDLLHAPWPDGAFDVVLAFRLLPHVAQWRELVRELTRLARRAVILDYPTFSSVNLVSQALFGWKKRIEGNTRPFTVFRDRVLLAAFAERGFRATGRRAQFLLPMALHRALASASLARGSERVAARLGLTRIWGSPVILRVEPA